MTRIFKYYSFPLGDGAQTMAKTIGMSSYPGIISSTDDFYMMDSNLVIADTSLEILDPSVYDKVQLFPLAPHVPNFMHILAVNRMAKTASNWANLYSKANTGTYNAQWMIVDYNAFTAGSDIADNTLWVVFLPIFDCCNDPIIISSFANNTTY